MKLHTVLTRAEIHSALSQVKQHGHVTQDIGFVHFDTGNSRTHPARYEIQLGTYNKTSGPGKSRRYKNSGHRGAGAVWAATYDEWGYFINRIFEMDPTAIFGKYKNMGDLRRVWSPQEGTGNGSGN